jgi:hypothetical protein
VDAYITIRRRSRLAALKFRIAYYYLNFKYSIQKYIVFLDMLWNNKTVWYYDWTYKRLLIYDAVDYLRHIRVDLDEVAYLNTEEGTIRAEKF